MTGIIAGLAASTRTGTIRGEDGSRFVFCGAAVLGDFASLAVGHRVSFVNERGSYTALNVFGEPVRISAAGKNRVDAPDLRYTGFHQSENVRTYGFAELTSLQTAQYCVTVDVALLLKHHIAVQDGPALCLRKLMSDLKESPESRRHQLGDDDLLALAASRAEASTRRKLRRPVGSRRGSPPRPFLPSDGNRDACAAVTATIDAIPSPAKHVLLRAVDAILGK